MALRKKRNRKKGLTGLPVSASYIRPASRRNMVAFGCLSGFLFMSYLYQNSSIEDGSFISTGAVSSPHADIETDCLICHDAMKSVSDNRCQTCHEKTSEFAVYDFKSHYQYRSDDKRRVSPQVLEANAGAEFRCGACHEEHLGRNNKLMNVSDHKCKSCHDFDSFDSGHPEFEFAREHVSDDSTLLMTHIRHTVFVLQRNAGAGSLDSLFSTLKRQTGNTEHFFEEACLTCHVPAADGKGFGDINFDQHCQQCHVKSDAAVVGLPAWNPAKPGRPGVETILQMQQRGGSGLSWTFALGPDLVTEEDGEVSKNVIVHKDPWILQNLKRLRNQAFPAPGLAAVLPTAGPAGSLEGGEFYSRVTSVLRNEIVELQNRSELGSEVAKLNLWLNRAEHAIKQPTKPGIESANTSGFSGPAQRMSVTVAADFSQLVEDLTAESGPECQRCHIVKDAAIQHVRANQKILNRAEFNHRAHVLERRCTDCHDVIPFELEGLRRSVESFSAFKKEFAAEFKLDRSATQNIPRIATCRECHSQEQVAANCVSCHKFHPNKLHRASLDLFWGQRGDKTESTNKSN